MALEAAARPLLRSTDPPLLHSAVPQLSLHALTTVLHAIYVAGARPATDVLSDIGQQLVAVLSAQPGGAAAADVARAVELWALIGQPITAAMHAALAPVALRRDAGALTGPDAARLLSALSRTRGRGTDPPPRALLAALSERTRSEALAMSPDDAAAAISALSAMRAGQPAHCIATRQTLSALMDAMVRPLIDGGSSGRVVSPRAACRAVAAGAAVPAHAARSWEVRQVALLLSEALAARETWRTGVEQPSPGLLARTVAAYAALRGTVRGRGGGGEFPRLDGAALRALGAAVSAAWREMQLEDLARCVQLLADAGLRADAQLCAQLARRTAADPPAARVAAFGAWSNASAHGANAAVRARAAAVALGVAAQCASDPLAAEPSTDGAGAPGADAPRQPCATGAMQRARQALGLDGPTTINPGSAGTVIREALDSAGRRSVLAVGADDVLQGLARALVRCGHVLAARDVVRALQGFAALQRWGRALPQDDPTVGLLARRLVVCAGGAAADPAMPGLVGGGVRALSDLGVPLDDAVAQALRRAAAPAQRKGVSGQGKELRRREGRPAQRRRASPPGAHSPRTGPERSRGAAVA
ncbi:unnamed protein product [Pedinophyceae sp. YPF-701]|nr:unnamed protein product [Pedinophyceae sp. YPF-701]